MTDDPTSGEHPRRFDRETAERILGRAASLALTPADPQISLAELERAADEVGIERSAVRRAVAELDVAPAPRRHGMRTRIVRRRLLPRHLHHEQLERMLTRADAFFGAHGERDVREGSASWTARHIHLTVEPTPEGSIVQVSERFVNTVNTRRFFSLMGGLWIAVMVGGLAGKAAGMGALGLLAALPLIPVVAWVLLAFFARSHEAKVDEIAESFERALDSLEGSVSDGRPALPRASEESDPIR